MSPPDRLVRPALAVYRHLPAGLRRRLARLTTPTFTVGALCVVLDGSRMLLVRHSYRRHWAAPGGLLDRDEVPEAAAVREVAEETGIRIELDGDAKVIVRPRLRRIDFVYRCRVAAGAGASSPRAASPEILEAGWFPLGALPQLHEDTADAMGALGLSAVSPSPRRSPSGAPSARMGGGASSGPSPRSGGPAPG